MYDESTSVPWASHTQALCLSFPWSLSSFCDAFDLLGHGTVIVTINILTKRDNKVVSVCFWSQQENLGQQLEGQE